MAQHFLLSAAARTLSLKSVFRMGEDAAYETFRMMRWPDGEASCPRCGCCETYNLAKRKQFECKGCRHHFSVTSGTIFANRKMSYTDLLAAIVIFVNGAKGVSALQVSRDLDVQYKTAFVLSHKLREAMALEDAGQKLSGAVEVDGAYFGGYVKPANVKTDRVDRRFKVAQNGKRQNVVVVRERGGDMLTFVGKSEGEGVAHVARVVEPGTVVHADEATPDDAGRALLAQASEAMRLSARGYTRVLRVARTIADLAGSEGVGRIHVAEALSYRRQAPRN